MADRPDDPGPPTESFPTAAGPGRPPGLPAAWVLSGRYRISERVGAGGMAQVFRARDELLDRDVAVKVFRTPVDEPGNASSVERRDVELKALARLSHPNLTALYDGSLADDGPAYLVMEYVDGPDLATRLEAGPLPYAEVQLLGTQIAGALAYVHARGMVHRDVKPANILLGADGEVGDTGSPGLRARLSDFGIVRMVNSPQLTHASFTLGSASYLAPEQARGSNVGPGAGVYALGLVLLEALTGVRAYDGPMHEAVAARLVRPPDIPASLRPPWPGLLAAMTALDPTLRPSAGETARVLSAPSDAGYAALPTATTAVVAPTAATVVGAAPSVGVAVSGARPATGARAGPPGPLAPEVRSDPRHRRTLIALGAAAAVVVLGLVLYLVLNSSSSGPSTDPTLTNSPTRDSTSAAPTPSQSSQPSTSSSSPGSSAPTSRSSSGSTPSSSPPTSSSAPSSSRSSQPSSRSSSRAPSRSSSSPSSESSSAGGAAGGEPAPVGSRTPSGSTTSTS